MKGTRWAESKTSNPERLPLLGNFKHPRPTACSACGTGLSGADPNPERHQVTEIPAVRPTVTEYQVHTLECPECGCRCRGRLPPLVPRGCFGPNVVAVVTLLSSFGRRSQRIIATLLQDLFGLQISDGQISRLQSIGRKAMQAGYDEIVVDVRNSSAVNMDETGWRENGRKAWLWTVVGRLGTLFAVRTSRSRAMATDLLGEKFNGIVVSDRYSACSHLENHCHQFCRAHLLRDFQAIIDRGGISADVGAVLKQCGQELIYHRNRLQSRQILRETFDGHYRGLRSEILDTLHDGSLCDYSKTAETCRRLSNECFSLFVFVHHHGVLPTNNAAEQALRKSVIFRKLSFGTDQQTGSRNMSVILSVIETCHRINRSRLDFLRESIHAAFRNKPAPRLLPTN